MEEEEETSEILTQENGKDYGGSLQPAGEMVNLLPHERSLAVFPQVESNLTEDQKKQLSQMTLFATTFKSLSSTGKKSNLTQESKDECQNKNIREMYHFDKSAASLQSKSATNVNTV